MGSQTSALYTGGDTGSEVSTNESWDGTNWTEVGDLNSAKRYMAAAAANNTAGLIFGGTPGPTANTESWDGSSWTEVANLNTARNTLAGAGTQTAALAFGGYTGTARTVNTELWNGSAWTEVNNLNTARSSSGS